jgi:3-dehydroquinate synthase
MPGMETQHAERIFLIGPTGSGKTTVGRAVAALLGWQFVDSDELVAEGAGRSIPAIFAEDGEAGFRDRETAALRAGAGMARVVVAVGAGAVERSENVALMRRAGWVVLLGCGAETALQRLRAAAAAQGGDVGAARPMLLGVDPLARMSTLEERRSAGYGRNDDYVSNEECEAHEAARGVLAGLIGRGLLPNGVAQALTRPVRTGSGEYEASVRWGGLATLAERLRMLGNPDRVFVVADANVLALYRRPLHEMFKGAGFAEAIYSVPAGEASKSREQLAAIHDWLAEGRAERGEPIVALGGGVVGDLAGFAAATYLRGLPLVQVPTSLLAQVDASIGGKTGINHPYGKNLIGAVYPPRLVLADPAALLTLPPRQMTEGWAEVVKHGVALDADYFVFLEQHADHLLEKHPRGLTEAIAGSVALKATVVEGDEREAEGGRRALLNYGHTIGHAIEAVAGYGMWLHGEAVSVGMVAAARLGRRLGVTPPEVAERQETLLARFGLPTRADGLAISALLRAALWDKKVRGGTLRWVLPTALGAARLVSDVADDDVRATLREIGSTDDAPEPQP